MRELGTQSTAESFRGLSWVFRRSRYVAAWLALPLLGLACFQLGHQGRMIATILWWGAIFLLAMPTRIRISEEGVTLRWLWVRHFIGHGDIEDASVYEELLWARWREIGVRIELRSGVIWLPMRLADGLSTFFGDPSKAAHAALTSLTFHRDHALAQAASAVAPAPPMRERNGP